jgi:hypothetical protein
MLYQAWQSLGKMAIHLGVQRPTDPLQTTVMDYTFKVNVLAGQLTPPPPRRRRNDGGLDVSSSGSDSDGWGSSAGDYLCLINLFLCYCVLPVCLSNL